ncbi:unnamed protein product [Cylindrotheca closterium]|uniref:tRNA pseudouridine(55) synthase n=1 Tax=Cylindrotheca closterium TaxID=2856 RepID=A0AAD2FV59_9STRA|nr:unnamed protein product [Cylindrotheca closterium]
MASAKKTNIPTDSTETSHQSPASHYICNTCRSYLATKDDAPDDDDDDSAEISLETVCSVCQNLWNPNSPTLKQSLEQACQIYGGMSTNHFSTSSITISLPGELNLNYRNASSSSAKPFASYIKDLKLFLAKEIQKLYKQSHDKEDSLPPILSIDEQGFLMIHLQCVPPKRDDQMMERNTKKKRSRWRPYVTQGGDPRVNLESRLQQQGGYQWHSMTDAEKLSLSNYQPPLEMKPMEYHFAVFRKPIYIYGYYTKSRRDVSQSPFVVMREQNNKQGDVNNKDSAGRTETEDLQHQPPNKKRKKVAETLGITSVEEQICNPIAEILGGISTQNNVSSVLPSQGNNASSSPLSSQAPPTSSNVQYGMCKFHASGREDMDVRMLIRPNSNTLGRPFCVQLIDAKQALQSQDQLNEIAHRINRTTTNNDITTDDDSKNTNNNKWKSELWHGQNPYGVGVCPEKLCLAPANAYSNLQSDTESKVKHYGCHCWSERILPKGNDDNDDKEESGSNNQKITALLFPELKLPLTIQQRTPLRVVHRRANLVRERQILQLDAWRVDDHHFRLEMSTQAGTYVKEFVHGDLLRTQPSIASIMGCKTNLLLLDCEGIQLTDMTA